ncbi:hypothetical protein ACMFMG_000389 [Clarireedia jacksonii]
MATPTSASHGNNPSQNSHPSSSNNHESVEMSNLNIDTQMNSGTDMSGLLNDISIPVTSPITSDYSSLQIPLPSDMQAAANDNQNTRPNGEATAVAATSEVSNSQSTPNDQLNPLSSSTSTSTPAPIITNNHSAANNTISPPAVPASSAEAPATTTTPQFSNPEPNISRPDPVASTSSTSAMSSSSTPPPADAAANPTLTITLLLTSGSRHPYKIDEKYLNKRGVNVPDVTEAGRKDPFSISVYTLKELILREWRDEWEAKPSSPSSIRLIFFGRLLDDKSALRECKFNPDGANIVHMTVTPQDLVDEEEAAKGGSSRGNRDNGEPTAGCRCVIL